MKSEHQIVLQNIEKALELVESKTPDRPIIQSYQSSPLRLREKINSVLVSGSSPTTPKTMRPAHPMHGSSPLSPAVEKSHITFDILNELENRPMKRKAVHFREEEARIETGNELSMASQEYLKKYGLI